MTPFDMNKPLLITMGDAAGIGPEIIAKAFRHAEEDDALLLIDEMDSFLQDRRKARVSWEVTLVNEMLTQMETFPGVFIASTNLVEGLDPASLRRFDIKVRFDFMKAIQARELCQRYCAKLGLSPPNEVALARFGRLGNLTPGDFAAVGRQSRFRHVASVEAFVDALEAECSFKEGAGKQAIGFV